MREIEAEWRELRDQAKDSAAFQASYEEILRLWSVETGAIEGLYDIERGVTETLLVEGFDSSALGPGATDNPELTRQMLKDHREALDLVFDFIKSERALSVGFIHELHAALTRSQSAITAQDAHGNRIEVPLTHGKFKTLPNFPRRGDLIFAYCPPEQTASEMERLVGMAQEYLEGQVPPEVLAAWLHHRFTQIHPYQDGNGRVARALATIVLVKAGFGPFTVDVQNKARYLDRLEDADRGDLRPLVLVVAREQDRVLRRVKARLLVPSQDVPLADVMARTSEIQRLIQGHGSNSSFDSHQVLVHFVLDLQELLSQLPRSLQGKGDGISTTYHDAVLPREDLQQKISAHVVVRPDLTPREFQIKFRDHMVRILFLVATPEPMQTINLAVVLNVETDGTLVAQHELFWESPESPSKHLRLLAENVAKSVWIEIAKSMAS